MERLRLPRIWIWTQLRAPGNASAFQVGLGHSPDYSRGILWDSILHLRRSQFGQFSATYTLHLSDEDLPGQQMQSLTLSLVGKAILAGDYNGDGSVDAGDYVIWQRSFGQTVAAAYSGADGDGNLTVDNSDYDIWRAHFGQTAPGSGTSLALLRYSARTSHDVATSN